MKAAMLIVVSLAALSLAGCGDAPRNAELEAEHAKLKADYLKLQKVLDTERDDNEKRLTAANQEISELKTKLAETESAAGQ